MLALQFCVSTLKFFIACTILEGGGGGGVRMLECVWDGGERRWRRSQVITLSF